MKYALFILFMLIGVAGEAQSIFYVTNYGAIADCTNYQLTTVSNSATVTSAFTLPASYVGDAVEIWGGGIQTAGANHQDYIGHITSIVGTSITLDTVVSNTLSSEWCTVGHDNRTNIQNCITAAGTSGTVWISSGNYLVLTITNLTASGWFSILLNGGGHIITGEGTNNTFLTGQGAWQLDGNGNVHRGSVFNQNPPITNNLPETLCNFSVFGGLTNGYTSNHGYPANIVTGEGWDGTHHFALVWGFLSPAAFNNLTYSNLNVYGFRGEMDISVDQSTNCSLTVVNCTFNDGNATAINHYANTVWTNCFFNNLFQVAEYYESYNTGVCYFVNNVCTNIQGNGFAINGAVSNSPTFWINGCDISFAHSGGGQDGFLAIPAANVIITNTTFRSPTTDNNFIVIGAAGAQGAWPNSNIVVTACSFTNPGVLVEISGTNKTFGLQFVNNIIGNPSPTKSITELLDYDYMTNVVFSNNVCLANFVGGSVSSNNTGAGFSYQNGGQSQYAIDDLSNIHYSLYNDGTGVTNIYIFGNGGKYVTFGSMAAAAAVILSNEPSITPPNATQLWTNSTAKPFKIMPNSANDTPITLVSNTPVIFYRTANNAAWSTNAPLTTATGGYTITGAAIVSGSATIR